MPRKKKDGAVAVAENPVQSENHSEPSDSARPAYIDGPPVTPDGQIIQAGNGADAQAQENVPIGQEKNWGPPYKAIFSSQVKGFEMGENRRFKQRVFKFKEKPDSETIATLKDNGFTYRPEEKSWTIPANEATRQVTDRLARLFAGESQEISR